MTNRAICQKKREASINTEKDVDSHDENRNTKKFIQGVRFRIYLCKHMIIGESHFVQHT